MRQVTFSTRPLVLSLSTIVAVLVSFVCCSTGMAATYSWTNVAGNVSGLWTNAGNWNPPSSYPGAGAGDNAFLTNSVPGAYTNLYNFSTADALTALTVSNTTGEAWLRVTNSTLKATTLNIGDGGRVQLDAGGILANVTNLNFSGSTGVLSLNGGTLKTFTTAGLFNGTKSVTATVTTVTSPGTWNAGAITPFIIGSGQATNNVLILDGAGIAGGVLLTNVQFLHVGRGRTGAGADASVAGNQLIVTNGATIVFNPGGAGAGGLVIGQSRATGITSSSNSVTIVGGGADSVVNLQDGGLQIGNSQDGTSAYNTLTVGRGGLITNVDGSSASYTFVGFSLASTSVAHDNRLIITDGGQVSIPGDLTIGSLTSGISSNNQLRIANGGALSLAGALYVGANSAGSSFNSALITNGGLLEANTLVLGTGAGNTISNVGGIFQFTNLGPTITPNGGKIAITNGTISFRAIDTANIFGNWSGAGNSRTLTNVAFAGANTFRLNAASNTISSAQNYTFNTGLGATNYVRLEMINGATAYRSGDITIGRGGSMLISSTIATVSGLVTNAGSLSVVGATVTFQSRVYNAGTNTMLNSAGTFNGGVINAGTWLTGPTTNILQGFGFTNTISGVVSMSAGDVHHFTNTVGVAANFINVSTNNVANNTLPGKMVFDGGLGLTQQFTVAGHDLGPISIPTATNAVTGLLASELTGFTTNFALGTLEISNFSTVRVTDAFLGLAGLGTNDNLMAGLYLNNLFMGADSLLIIDTNVQVYFLNSNNWTSANFQLAGNPTFDNTFNGLHQLIVIPEPNVLVLVLGGMLTMLFARRRHRQRNL